MNANDSQQPDDPQASPASSAGDDDPRLVAAVQEYVAELEAGRHPRRQEFLSRYPEIAPQLSTCLQGLAFVQSAAAQLDSQPAVRGDDLGPDFSAQPLGDFQLVRQIGRGGMGTVYEAIQLSLGRRVALKVLPFAAALDHRQLQRFRNEAQAAAQLHHTSIVPVYAVGCERSVHYYAMQLIEGQSLADVITEMRRALKRDVAAGDGAAVSASLSMAGGQSLSMMHTMRRPAYFQAVARLGLHVADALAYAHRMGVVHRDIKPANLLLDAQGNVWITDFGLAQCYSDNSLTQTGDLVGTLRYMSPEQASGRAVVLDERTDIYSLGITLYEMLTLERALPGQTREQLLYQIDFQEPRSPRAIDRLIPAELETILRKAIAKEPAERYASAGAMADDLRRFLEDKPILARPPSAWDQCVKWTRRHRSLALSALLVSLLAAVGLAVSTLLIAREQARTRQAWVSERQKATEATEQRARAEESFRQAREAVDFFSGIAAQQMEDSPFTDVRKQMLEAALDYYQGFLEQHRADGSISAELSAAQAHVATILTELSAFDEFGRVQARAMLLFDPSVREALQMSSEQVSKLQSFFADSRLRGGGMIDLRQLTSEQKRHHFSALASDTESAIGGILTAAQGLRLRQISRQVRGPSAFSDPDVVEAMALSREQKERVRQVQGVFRDAMRDSFRRGGPHPRLGPGAGPEPPPELPKPEEAVAQVLGFLRPEQVQRWRELTGEPFTARLFGPGRPFGPPDFGRGPEPHGPGMDQRGPDQRGRGGREPGMGPPPGPEGQGPGMPDRGRPVRP